MVLLIMSCTPQWGNQVEPGNRYEVFTHTNMASYKEMVTDPVCNMRHFTSQASTTRMQSNLHREQQCSAPPWLQTGSQ